MFILFIEKIFYHFVMSEEVFSLNSFLLKSFLGTFLNDLDGLEENQNQERHTHKIK